MKLILLLVLIISLLVIASLLVHNQKPKIKFTRPKKLEIKLSKDKILEVESCDIKHYNNINEEYNKRKKWYQNTRENNRLNVINQNDIEEIIIIPEQYYLPNNYNSQNVHDTIVMNNIKIRVQTIPTSVSDDTFFINQFEDKHRVILDKIKQRNANLVSYNKTEYDIIKDVWNNSENQPLVRDQYLKDLEDCVDTNNNLYCPTGVVNRIISSTYITEPENMPKTKEILNNEILNKFSVSIANGYSKEETKEKVILDYSGIYDSEKIENIIQEWYEFV